MKDQLRLLIISWCYFPRIGGPATDVKSLCKEFTKRRFETKILSPGEEDGIIKVKLRSKFVLFTLIEFIFKSLFLLRREIKNFDILQAHDFSVSTVLASFFKRFFNPRLKIISVFTGDSIFEFLNYFKKNSRDYEYFLRGGSHSYNFLKHVFRVFIASMIDIVVVPQKSLVSSAKSFAPSSRIVIIPPLIDVSLFSPGKKELLLLMVTRMVSWKNVEEGIKVFIRLRRKIKDLKMIVIGDGFLFSYYYRKYKNIDGLIFSGKMKHKEIISYYKKALVFLLPSLYETFSISLSEALAAGCISIVSDIPLFRKRFKNGEVYFVNFKEGNKVSKLIENIIKNQDRKRWEDFERFSPDRIASKYISLYHEVENTLYST